MDDMDKVFKALADPSRRQLLDRLRVENGQTLGALCAELNMSRQAVTQHIALLEAANLITVFWRGREKLHYLNPVPIHDIAARWIAKFERNGLDALHTLKQRLEGEKRTMNDKPQFIYVTYITTTPQKLWNALLDPSLTTQYWFHHNVSDWKVGSEWRHQRCDEANTIDIVGKVLEVDEPRRLVLSWASPASANDPAAYSQVAYDIEALEGLVKLTVTHSGLQPDSAMLKGISFGWPVVLSSLKSLLETGQAIPLWWLEKSKQNEKCKTAE